MTMPLHSTWRLMTAFALCVFSSNALCQTNKNFVDPEINGMDLRIYKSHMVVRVITYNRNVTKAQRNPKAQPLLVFELLPRYKLKKKIDVKILSFDELTKVQPFTWDSDNPDSRMEAVLDEIEGNDTTGQMRVNLHLTGIKLPDGKPYTLQCTGFSSQYRWTSVICLPLVQTSNMQ